MNNMLRAHAVRLTAPFFNKGKGAQLHRYLDAEFVQRFKRELQLQQLDDDSKVEWQSSDRFSDHDNKMVLRLPMHRSFYVVSCEVVCEQLGQPALAPPKISSAGFVIRRLANGGEQSWMVEEDEELGWEDTPTGLRDPDVHRRLCRDGTLHPRENVATYTGEKTHPLHPETAYDEKGKRRTVLFGYLPLGGNYTVRRDNKVPFDSESLAEFSAASKEHLPWPYGYRKPLNKSWRSRYARPVENGIPSDEFFELIKLLCNRYHLGDTEISENEGLQELCESIYFYDENLSSSISPESFNDYSKDSFSGAKKYSLWSWLQKHFSKTDNPLTNWIVEQEQEQQKSADFVKNLAKLQDFGIEIPNPSSSDFEYQKLPNRNGTGNLRYSLYITSGDARDLRSLLEQRVLDQALSTVKEIPMPKFNQGAQDIYQIVPFIRTKDDDGKERIFWCEENVRSEIFRVAAPFDPMASRPSVIQMPSLSDLKKGMAKGVSMITPPDTFDLINSLNLKKGASEDVLPEGEGSGIGIQWICSFSLPAITLVAMIILMIMISLLNIVFSWMAWIKICLPFPKVK